MQCYQLAQRRDLPSLSPTSQPRAKRGFSLRRGSEPVRTREIYRSPTGDRWLLARDPETSRVFVRHESNLPSGGHVADIEIGAFLIAARNGPEKQELLRLIGTLA